MSLQTLGYIGLRTKNLEEFNEVVDFLQVIGSLLGLGLNTINFQVINATHSLEISKPLPTYPLAPKPLPLYAENSRMAIKQKRHRKGPLNHEYMAINALTHPDLAQHVVKGEPILPATAFFEMVRTSAFVVSFCSMTSCRSLKRVLALFGTLSSVLCCHFWQRKFCRWK